MRALFAACLTLFTLSVASTGPAWAHCQIPCGIFDDMRVLDELNEHATTIARSVDGIAEAGDSLHDVARWTMNKEYHADRIMDTAQAHFLAQRVTPVAAGEEGYEAYLTSLTLLHEMIVAAMRTKQSAQMGPVGVLQDAIEAYRAHYIALHGHEH